MAQQSVALERRRVEARARRWCGVAEPTDGCGRDAALADAGLAAAALLGTHERYDGAGGAPPPPPVKPAKGAAGGTGKQRGVHKGKRKSGAERLGMNLSEVLDYSRSSGGRAAGAYASESGDQEGWEEEVVSDERGGEDEDGEPVRKASELMRARKDVKYDDGMTEKRLVEKQEDLVIKTQQSNAASAASTPTSPAPSITT